MTADRSDKFVSAPGDLVFSQCLSCRHFSAGPFGAGCRAFPGGIPDEVMANKFDHRRPHPDEAEPVRFEPRADVPAVVLAPLFRELDSLHTSK